jgi:transposase
MRDKKQECEETISNCKRGCSVMSLEERIPADHPLREVRKLVDAVLAGMSKDFDGLYSEVGRPSIAPERLLRALLLQVFSVMA